MQIYKLYETIKEICNNKESKSDFFDLQYNNNIAELWVKTNDADILLLEQELNKKEYRELCYSLYKNKVNVYLNEI